ncbi:MAG: radical SAM-modified peptide, FtsH ternary system-associated [Xenococcaceae cyanobacterium]
MDNSGSNLRPKTRFVPHLPDLITEEDYLDSPEQQKIRVRIELTDQGVEILGDSMYAHLVEELLTQLGADEIERMLCG